MRRSAQSPRFRMQGWNLPSARPYPTMNVASQWGGEFRAFGDLVVFSGIYRDASGVTGRRAEERFAVLAMEWFWNQRDQDDEFVNWLRFLGCEILW